MERLSEGSNWEASQFAERLGELMAERNLNAPALARAIGVDSSTITRYLRCTRLPRYSAFVRLIGYFGCSADFMLGLKDESAEGKGSFSLSPFSERFRFVLKETGTSQYRLYHRAHISWNNLSKWLNGKTEPYVDSLVRLARELDCSVDFLIGRSD